LHAPTYQGKSVAQFIVNELGYRNVDEFKADSKVYDILNTKGNSVEVMLTSLKSTNCFIVNKYSQTVDKAPFCEGAFLVS